MPSGTDAVIIAARRTPIGTAGHAFAAFTAADLAAPVLSALADRTAGLDLPIDDVILGNCLGPGGNIARVAALAAGLPGTVPGVTVDRQCGSGLDAVLQGAARIRSGWAELVLAGGVESASTAPWRFWPPVGDAAAVRYQRAPFAPPGFPDPEMGPAADDVARRCGITRAAADAYAARSHQLAAAAVTAGAFDAECVPVGGVHRDERPRRGRTAGTLARLRPAFAADGVSTAGNSCGISDGAAAAAIVPESVRAGHGLAGLRILGAAVTAGDPALPGLGPVAAIRRVLDRTGTGLGDLAAVEITEAFAAQVLAVTGTLGIDVEKVCPQGGAIALGHPWGASGAVLLTRLFHRLQPGELGLATCAVGGGQGIAVLVEAVPGG